MRAGNSRASQPEVNVGLATRIDNDGYVHWELCELIEEELSNEKRHLTRWLTPLVEGAVGPMREKLLWFPVGGTKSDVLRRGVLRALVSHVIHAEHDELRHSMMESLCWAVLRRYAIEEKCLPHPPHKLRTRVWMRLKGAIEREKKKAINCAEREGKNVEEYRRKLEEWLRPPRRFFSAASSVPESGDWDISESVVIAIGTLRIEFCLSKPIDELLKPKAPEFTEAFVCPL